MSGRIDGDGVLHAALRQVNVESEDENVDLNGPMPAAVRRAHAEARAWYLADNTLGRFMPRYDVLKASVTGDMTGLVVGRAKSKVMDTVNNRLGTSASFFVQAGIATIEAAINSVKEGQELHASLVRSCAYLATCGICLESLPDGFLAAKIAEVPREYRPAASSARLPWPQGADRAHTALLAMPNAAEIRRAFNDACREGQRAALAGGARFPEELDLLLRREDIRTRYEEDPAFRVGFDSARWALGNHKADELRSNLGIFNRADVGIQCRG